MSDPDINSSRESVRSRIMPTWMPWVFVAVLAAICLWLLQLCLTLRAQTTLLQQQLELNDVELRSLRQHLEAERILSRHLATPSSAETPPPAR